MKPDLRLTTSTSAVTSVEAESTNYSPVRRRPTFALFALGCLAFSLAPKAFGVVPPPNGGYLAEFQ